MSLLLLGKSEMQILYLRLRDNKLNCDIVKSGVWTLMKITHWNSNTKFTSTRMFIVWKSSNFLKGSDSPLDLAAGWIFLRLEGFSSMNKIWETTEQAAGCLCYSRGQQQKPLKQASGKKAQQLCLIPKTSRIQWGSKENKGRLSFSSYPFTTQAKGVQFTGTPSHTRSAIKTKKP